MERRGRGRRAAALLPVLALVLAATDAGCGAPDGRSTPAAPSASPTLLVASATVLDSGRGPELCLGPIATSLPPQCSGPPIDGWDWPEDGTRRSGSVTWGAFFVVGTWDGHRFTFDRLVTEEEATPSLPPREDDLVLSTPCPEPEGGWVAPDPTRATSADQQNAFALAERLPGFVELWIDDRGDPAQDTRTTVVNVQVTRDVEEAERRLREVWGGPLCVSLGTHTKTEVQRVQDIVADEPDVLLTSSRLGVLTVVLVFDDGAAQQRYDDRFGAGLIKVESALRPYRG